MQLYVPAVTLWIINKHGNKNKEWYQKIISSVYWITDEFSNGLNKTKFQMYYIQ